MLTINNVHSAIFDIDGTLLDSMGIWSDLCSRCLRSLGVEPDEDVDSIVSDMTMQECASYVVGRYHLTKTTEQFEEIALSVIDRFYREEVGLKPGAMQLVTSLYKAGIPMILVTTADKELARAALTRNEIFQYFRALITCDEYGTSKGESFIFKKALEILGASDEGVYVFEDSLKAIRTARQIGYITVGIKDKSDEANWELIEECASYTVDGLDDITYR